MTTGFELFCLAILCLGLTMVVYAMVWLHGVPHHIAEGNNHPHKRTIHHACWLSLFTLHAIWPLVYLWAIMPGQKLSLSVDHVESDKLAARIEALEKRLQQASPAASSAQPAVTAPQVGA